MAKLFRNFVEEREASKLERQATELYNRSLETRSPLEIEDAIAKMRRAVNLAPENAGILEKMCMCLLLSHHTTHLSDAICFAKRATENTPGKRSIDRARRMVLQAKCMLEQHICGFGPHYLDQGLQLTQDALQLIDKKEKEGRRRLMSVRAELLYHRYMVYQMTEDLNESDLCSEEREDSPSKFGQLTRNCFARYDRVRDVAYVNKAFEWTKKWLTHIERYQLWQNHSRALSCMGRIHFHWYTHTHNMRYLRESISYHNSARRETKEDDPDDAIHLDNLASCYMELCEYEFDPATAKKAIGYMQQSILRSGEKGSVHALSLLKLGKMYRDIYEITGNPADRDSAIENFEASSRHVGSAPFARLAGAQLAVKLLYERGDRSRANSLAQDTLGLLAVLCSRYQSREDQQRAMFEVAGFAAVACSLALSTREGILEHGSVSHGQQQESGVIPAAAVALQSLEHGRGLIIGYLIDTKAGPGELRDKKYSDLAEQLDRIMREMATNADMADRKLPYNAQERFMKRRKVEQEAQALLTRIRSLEGLGRFLLPPLAEDMTTWAADGPVVFVNVTDIGSHALIVLSSGIHSVPLPDLQVSDLDLYQQYGMVRGGAMRAAKVVDDDEIGSGLFLKYLAWLWKVCVRLVLDELDIFNPEYQAQVRTGRLKRVWWIGTGRANSLPFHAAGIHTRGSTENAFSHVISSYALTMKSLHYSRQASTTSSEQSLLFVPMPKTPTLWSLPGVENEMKAIEHVLEKSHLMPPRKLDFPSPDMVLDELMNYTMIHFACHGESDPVDPSNSALLLWGDSDTVPARLSVKDVSRAKIGKSWLAYLSACSTAESKFPGLADEGLHLASGFQVAGFRHVIASMWPSNDQICAAMSKTFYQYLTEKPMTEVIDDYHVAWALHMAVNKVRSSTYGGLPLSEQPAFWAQYIHFGA